MAAHQPISPSAYQRRFLSFFLVLLCCRLTEERVRASKSFNASWCRIGLNHSQEPLPLIWIAAIILVKGWWWRASEAFHLHAASGGSSAQISLECSCSQRGCAGVKWSRMQSDRGAGHRRVTALADWTPNLTRQSWAGRPALPLQSCAAAAAALLCRAESHEIKQANECWEVGGAAWWCRDAEGLVSTRTWASLINYKYINLWPL